MASASVSGPVLKFMPGPNDLRALTFSVFMLQYISSDLRASLEMRQHHARVIFGGKSGVFFFESPGYTSKFMTE